MGCKAFSFNREISVFLGGDGTTVHKYVYPKQRRLQLNEEEVSVSRSNAPTGGIKSIHATHQRSIGTKTKKDSQFARLLIRELFTFHYRMNKL